MIQYTPHAAPTDFDWIVRLMEWRTIQNALIVHAQTAHGKMVELCFQALAVPAWRVSFTLPDAVPEPTTPICLPEVAASVLPLHVHQPDAHTLTAEAGSLRARIHLDPWMLEFLDADGGTLCRENPTDIDGLGRPFVLPLGFVAGSSPLVTQSFHLHPDEHFFGLGEKFTPLDKRGQRIISWTQDAFGSTSERSHKNIPFLMSTRGYGLLFDTGARITWELGTQSCQSYTIAAETPTFNLTLILGSTPEILLERYTALTGRTTVPPAWSFGLWLSGGGTYRDRTQIEAMIEEAEDRKMPFDVLHIDTWWMKWRRYVNYRFDAEAFPDIDGFIRDLHERGLRLSLWNQPYISVESELFDEAVAQGYLLKTPHGEPYIIDYGLSLAPRPDGIIREATPETSWNARVALVDFTNPSAAAWYQDQHRPLFRMGVDVFKTDFGEDVPADAVFHNGQTGALMHNLYPLLYNHYSTEVVEQEKGYRLVWSRSGTAGNQRYPVCWSGDPAGDWDSLACTIRGGLSIGLSGIPFWSSDIGGFRGMPEPEVYIRWAQFTLLCSHARMHGDSPREPWAFGDEADSIVRRYITLRYRLFPYLYSLAHEAAQNGMPVIRALPLAFPDDPNTYNKDMEYLLGSSILVAPIYTADGERNIYFPEGTWIDFWTGEVIRGQTNRRIHANLDILPLYLRAGSTIPLMASARRIPDDIATLPLELLCVPGTGESHFPGLGAENESLHLNLQQMTTGTRLSWQTAGMRRLSLRAVQVGQPVALDGTMIMLPTESQTEFLF